MTVCGTVGVTPPKPPIVWQAVAYARMMAPLWHDFDDQKAGAKQAHAEEKGEQAHWKRHQCNHATHEHALEALVGEWLTVRGSDDLSIILAYIDQMEELRKAFWQSISGMWFSDDLELFGSGLIESDVVR